MDENPFAGLEDWMLAEVAVSEGEDVLQLILWGHHKGDVPGKKVWIQAWGDCCSTSWWADILGVQSNLGGIITGARAIEMAELFDHTRSRQDYDRQYGYELYTTKGTVSFVFRNSSNGYYGGWATLLEQPDPETRWRQITTDDWSA